MKRLQVTDPRVQQAIALYKSGIAVKPICLELKMDDTSLRKILREVGILRTREKAGQLAKGVSNLKEDCLDVLTPEALYWIGFLYADGHIEKDRPRVTLTLAEKDKKHLEKMCLFFGNDLRIKDVTPKDPKKNPPNGQKNFEGRYYRVSFSSKKIYNILKDYGFSHSKTLYLIPNELLRYSRDFWRGVIDGDGWLCYTNDSREGGKYNKETVGVCGTKETVEKFLEFVNINEITTVTKSKKDGRSSVYQCDIHGKAAIKISELLYKDSTIYLDRKYEKYLEFNNTTPGIVSQDL